MLKNRNILLGVSGGIAVYKAIDLASRLSKAGAVVKVIMTENAQKFVSPLSFKSITHQAVITDMFDPVSDIEHISLADWADILIIAPATANIIGKTASGIADDLLSTTIMAATSPILFVPAMNVHMFENPILQRNIFGLNELGYFFVEPETGKLACGYTGKGRFPEVEEIIYHIRTYLKYERDLVGKTILVTAGATRERIDPMRFLSNYSSGKMGLAIARAAFIRGADVLLISAHITQPIPEYLKNICCRNAEEMYQATIENFSDFQTTFMVAAVSDYTVLASEQKIKKDRDLKLEFMRTKDILAEIKKNKNQQIIGFAAESENILENAQKKLKQKNLDFICANDLKVAGKDETEIVLISKTGKIELSGDKFSIANRILDLVYKL